MKKSGYNLNWNINIKYVWVYVHSKVFFDQRVFKYMLMAC